MDIYSKWQAIATLLMATGAIVVTFWTPEKFAWKLLIVFLFVVAAIVTIWLQEQKENRERDRAEKTQKELLNWQRGDAQNPPRVDYAMGVDPVTNKLVIRFTVINPSEFPAYDIGGRLWDIDDVAKEPKSLEDILSRDIVSINIPSLAPHTTEILAKIEVQPDVERKGFGAQFTTRVGAFVESIQVRRIDKTWLFATEVRGADAKGDVVFHRADPKFPLNKDGSID
jgi:hypothetical protein